MRPALLLCFAFACSARGAGPGDAGSGDARGDVVGDAPEDAGAEVLEASPPTWCVTRSPRPTFCDDFDRGDLGASWDFFQQTPPGVAAPDLAVYVSPPASFGLVTRKCALDEVGTILLR